MKINKIIVIGCGGTGGFLIPPLARYMNSRLPDAKLILCDGDSYSTSNVERQVFNATKLGMNKAEYQAAVLATQIVKLIDDGRISYKPEYLSKENVEYMVGENTVVINCADNNAIRKYVEDHILTLQNACHICCGNENYTGQIIVSYRKDGAQVTPSIYDLAPEFNSTNDDRADMSCEDLAALPSGGQVVSANLMSASLALNAFIGLSRESQDYDHGNMLNGAAVYFNCGTNSTRIVGSIPPTFNNVQKS